MFYISIEVLFSLLRSSSLSQGWARKRHPEEPHASEFAGAQERWLSSEPALPALSHDGQGSVFVVWQPERRMAVQQRREGSTRRKCAVARGSLGVGG
jgi:hypothetical protein